MRRRLGLVAFAILTVLLTPATSFAKNPGPLDIPDSQVLKMSIDQYIDAYTKKHNGDINEPETRALCYYYAELRRDQNFRLARRLSRGKRNLVRRCQATFDSLSQACFDYQYNSIGGTIVYDFYASLEVQNEAAMHDIVRDLAGSRHPSRKFRRAGSRYLRAWAELRAHRDWPDERDLPTWVSRSELLTDYHRAETALRNAHRVIDALPDSAKADFAQQVYSITDTLDETT